MNHNPLNDTIFEQLEHFFNELKPIYIISYVTLYGVLLLAARYWVYLFIIIIGIQIISLLCNSAIIVHFIKQLFIRLSLLLLSISLIDCYHYHQPS